MKKTEVVINCLEDIIRLTPGSAISESDIPKEEPQRRRGRPPAADPAVMFGSSIRKSLFDRAIREMERLGMTSKRDFLRTVIEYYLARNETTTSEAEKE